MGSKADTYMADLLDITDGYRQEFTRAELRAMVRRVVKCIDKWDGFYVPQVGPQDVPELLFGTALIVQGTAGADKGRRYEGRYVRRISRRIAEVLTVDGMLKRGHYIGPVNNELDADVAGQ